MLIPAENIITKIKDEAFKRGYQAGFAAVREQIAKALKDPEQPPLRITGNPFRDDSGAWQVFEYVKAHPGHKTAEIRAALQLTTKTAEMALRRMRSQGYAIKRDGWRLL